MKFELAGPAADAIDRIAEITDRKPDEVVSDALRTYLWILHEQSNGKTLLCVNGAQPAEIESLIKNDKAAYRYFVDTLGWK
jgi:hypothetical protein